MKKALLIILSALASLSGAQLTIPPVPRPTTIVIAASNSTAQAKASADVVCSGSGDQTKINAAIVSLGTLGGRIVMREGQYSISASIVVNQSYVTLEGESHPTWGGWISSPGGWTNTSNPVGLVGNAGTKIIASGTGYDLITILDTNVPDGGESRHRGNCFRSLYLVGDGYTAQGISGGNSDDMTTFEDLFIQRCTNGISVSMDSAMIRNCNIQDDSGTAIKYGTGHLGTISGCLIYDVGGNGIEIDAGSFSPPVEGTTITGNNIGDTPNGYAVYLNGPNACSVSGNSIHGACAGGVVTSGGGYHSITGNTFENGGSSLSLPTTASAVVLGNGTATSFCTVTGNVFYSSVASSGWAIQVIGLSTAEAIIGNNISPSGYRNGFANSIFWTAGSTVANNQGDNGVASGNGPAAVTSVTWQGWWKADALAYSNNASVTSWLDSSGAASTLVNNTTDPTFKTNVQNSLPAVLFDGSANAMKLTTFPAFNQPTTFFIVCQEASATGNQSLVNAITGGSATNAVYINAGAVGLYAGTAVAGTSITGTNWNVIQVTFNGSSSKTAVNSGTTTTVNPGTGNMVGGFIIGSNSNFSAGFFNGYIGEVAFATGVISSGDATTVRLALEAKWGITGS